MPTTICNDNLFAIDSICSKYEWCHENVEYQKEKLHDDVEGVTVFFISRG